MPHDACPVAPDERLAHTTCQPAAALVDLRAGVAMSAGSCPPRLQANNHPVLLFRAANEVGP